MRSGDDVLIPFTQRVACPAMYSDKDEIRWGGKSAGGGFGAAGQGWRVLLVGTGGVVRAGDVKQLATICLAGKQKFKVDDLEVYCCSTG